MKCIWKNCNEEATKKIIIQDEKQGHEINCCEKHWYQGKLVLENIMDDLNKEVL